ncbi:MAG: hypothetical protein ABF242_08385 [Flavobacteriales bacterium]
MKIKGITYSLLLAVLLVFASCTKEKENDPDPCCGETPVTANFGMMNITGTFLNFYDFTPDVAFTRNYITFRAMPQDPDATYTWYLGTEILTGSQISRDFSPTVMTGENNIPISLVIRKTPNIECYPNDDGYDSIVKYIKLVDDKCEFLTNGDFKVLFDGKSDSSIVSIRNWLVVSNGTYTPDCNEGHMGIGFDIANPTDTNWTTARSGLQTNSTIIFKDISTTKGNWYNGSFKVNPNTLTVEADYYMYRLGGNSDRYNFKGRKIN